MAAALILDPHLAEIAYDYAALAVGGSRSQFGENSPCAARTPRLRAAAGPAFG